MLLKNFLFALILHLVVRAQCEDSHEVLLKQETIAESANETKTEEKVDESATESSEITLALNGSDLASTTAVVSDVSTSALGNETDHNASEVEDLTLATTALDIDNNDIYNATTDNTTVDGDTETTTPYLSTGNTEPVNATITDVTENTTNATDETTNTDETTISSSEVTAKETVPDTTTTTEMPTTPIDILCPQVEEADIDQKYRNETFELYLEEYMKKNPLAKVYKSPGFPGPYAENLNCTLSVTLSNCTGVHVFVHYLDLNPFEHDSLNIRGGDEDATDEEGKELTGQQFGIDFHIIHSTSLYVWFKSGYHGTREYRGFLLTYSPYGNDTLPPTTTEAPITIPPSNIEFYQLQLALPKGSRSNETWEKFRDVLTDSASTYVTDQNLNYQLPHPDNVTINIYDCPDNWPNYENCVQLRFAIALWSLDYDPDIHYDVSSFDYELSTNSLSVMWDLYGRDDFLEILGVEEYTIPDGTYILLLWTGISLAIVVIFIGVLYSIWRIDIFREYRRMHNRSDDQQDILKSKSELDISMYPIPHQPYPTLFETSEMNSGCYYDSHEMNSTSFHNHSFQEKPSTNYRHSNTTPFTPNMLDFNDTQLFPDDEENFGRVQSLSPRSKQKLLVLGAKRDESNS
ncbi:uncharacterized protein LOC119081536 [Bradysia coprophila]|uniref:uncharacterized protein LOC119081536 n=1 Tax=Bradysia coprophila TaxID=38358 RepID=UPI00187DD7DE|nr:uncharacterized protein LOC119081536 [Bradysia coprophila]